MNSGLETPPPNPLATSVDTLFTKEQAADAFAGTVIVVDDGKVVLQKSYGLADRSAKRANTDDGIYRIGSVTKQFTAAAILALAEDGKLSVDDPVSKYFPEYPQENLEKNGVAATLHHLLCHTSGIGDGRTTQYFKDNVWYGKVDPKLLLAAAAQLPMKAEPGTTFAYSNFGYYLLALVVERVSGAPYDAFVKQRIFAPAGMTDSAVLLSSLSPAQAARVPHGYAELDGEIATLDSDRKFIDRDMVAAFGSGQILSTVADLAKWDRALADRKILTKYEDALFTPNLDDYGYGFIVEKRNGVTVEWHNGALSPLGFAALVVRVPEKNRFVAYLANLDWQIVQPLEEKVLTLATK